MHNMALGAVGSTVDRQIFMLRIICRKYFRGVKFLWFRYIREIFLMADSSIGMSAWSVPSV